MPRFSNDTEIPSICLMMSTVPGPIKNKEGMKPMNLRLTRMDLRSGDDQYLKRLKLEPGENIRDMRFTISAVLQFSNV